MKIPRRVLILHDYAGGRGGAEHIALELRRGLRTRGIAAKLLTSTADPWDDDGAPDSTCPGRTDRFRVISETWNPAAARAVARELEQFQPDVVHIVMFLTQLSPAILSVLDAVPTVSFANTYRISCPTGLRWHAAEKVCTAEPGLACWRHGCISPLGSSSSETDHIGPRSKRLSPTLVEVVADRGKAQTQGEAGLTVAMQRLSTPNTSWIDQFVNIYADLLASARDST